MTNESDIGATVQGAVLPDPRVRRGIREAVGLTVSEVAALAGCSRWSVYRWEAGTAEPIGERRRRYAGVLSALREGRADGTG
jgi:predicted transcriptional regulator